MVIIYKYQSVINYDMHHQEKTEKVVKPHDTICRY